MATFTSATSGKFTPHSASFDFEAMSVRMVDSTIENAPELKAVWQPTPEQLDEMKRIQMTVLVETITDDQMTIRDSVSINSPPATWECTKTAGVSK